MARLVGVGLFGLGVLLAFVVAATSARYLMPEPVFPAPPMLPQIEQRLWAVWLHVGGGVTALALGPFQPLTRTGVRRAWHRWAGRVYAAACLIGAAGGLMLAVHSSSGWIAQLGFGLLAAAWAGSTIMGWRLAVKRQLVAHRRWMLRSLALTFAAVTLRLQLPLAEAIGVEFIDAYRAIAFLCWVPNLLAMEAYLAVTARWKVPGIG